MSMLAEKKRKQKWSLNPRGNDWIQDSNKFGQKILEKMGWQNGKGLGAKENGITEHIKVSYKNDSKGMGYKESNDQWTEHETNFSALLESLSGEKSEEIKLNSLEKKSQSSRARVHYHKFTRGKDLSRYSEKDLANIFGKKTLKEQPKVKVAEEKTDDTEETKDSDSKFIFNAGSMRDYFKKKLPAFGKSNGYVIGHNGVLKKGESDSETDVRPSFSYKTNEKDDGEEEVSYVGFGFKSEVTREKNSETVPEPSNGKVTFVSYVNGDNEQQSKEKKGKKKRKVKEHETENVLSPKKKMRKPKDESKHSESDSDKGVSNPAFNPLQTPVKVQKHVLDTIEETVSEGKSDSEDDALRSVVTTAQVHKGPQNKEKESLESTDISVVVEDSNGVNVKAKKQFKKSVTVENGLVNINFAECETVDLTVNGSKEEAETSAYEVKRKVVKKKKKENKPTNGNTNEVVQEVIAIEEDSCEVKIKKTKKKKEKRIDEDITVDLTSDESKQSDFQNSSGVSQIKANPYEVKVKKTKKKNKESKSYENPTIDLSIDDSGVSSVGGETPSKAKTKKKEKQINFALENPSFDDNSVECINLTQIEENPYEVKVKKKKKVKCGVDNVNFDESTEESAKCSENGENPYEVKVAEKKKKKKKEKDNYAIENPNFNEFLEESSSIQVEENPYEVKPKKKKKKKENYAVDNPNFNANDSMEKSSDNFSSTEETKAKTNKNNDGTSTLDMSSSEIKENISLNIEDSDLILNIVTTPIITRTRQTNGENSYSVTKINSAKRRKSVRFSDVTQERIIPNNEDIRNVSDVENRNELFEINTQVINNGLQQQDISFDMSALDKVGYDDSCEKLGKKRKLGLDNVAFDKHKTNLEENVESISKTLDRYQAEIENDINEKKLGTLTMEDVMIGEVGNPHGEHEKLPEGTRLKFKYANLSSRTPFYHLDKTGAKKSYRHLIKGDIVVGFKNTNLHEIAGYAAKKKSTEV